MGYEWLIYVPTVFYSRLKGARGQDQQPKNYKVAERKREKQPCLPKWKPLNLVDHTKLSSLETIIILSRENRTASCAPLLVIVVLISAVHRSNL